MRASPRQARAARIGRGKPQACPDPEAHDAHMQMNGECPWCGASDAEQMREPADFDFPDAEQVR